ncbi:hypothetical protein [Actinomadura sp. 21ATH]|uniref:hypothetical protein n=1 Tax=Actinomadura sp. 21ATH TaxID=1735444 RepID=UPI0035BF66B2
MNMHDRSDDFGLTVLAIGWFTPTWWTRYPSAPAVLEDIARNESAPSLQQYVCDARLLAGSSLTPRQLEEIWRSATAGHHAPSTEGIDGREWFERLISIMEPAVLKAGLSTAVEDEIERDDAVVRAVRKIVDRLSIRQNFERDPVEEPSLRTALSDLAADGRPELALRFLVRIAINHYARLDAALEAQIRQAGRRFGYGEFFFEQLDHLKG